MPSTEKEYALDLTRAEPLAENVLEARMRAAREQIAAGFADKLPLIVEGYIDLATNEDVEPDVRRKASDRILDTFLPTAGKLQHAQGTTIQILNALPLPEVRVIDGKEAPTATLGPAKFALTSPKKRTILPANEDTTQKRRQQFLGPQVTTSSESPAPVELPTPLKK